MNEYSITVNVIPILDSTVFQKPVNSVEDYKDNKITANNEFLYRLYLNNTLLTERQVDMKTTITEEISANLTSNIVNIISISPYTPHSISFVLNNLQINNNPYPHEQVDFHTIKFTIE